MREIKFKAYQQHNSLNRRSGIYEGQDIVWYDEPSDGYTGEVFFKGYDDSEYMEDVELIQFTGIHDKNGTESYHNDLVDPHWDNGEIYQVVWNGYYARFELKLVKGDNPNETLTPDQITLSEIIGSIYELPRLMGAAK